MGMLLEGLPSQHVYRSCRRLTAIKKKDEKLQELQLAVAQLKWELSSWHNWWCARSPSGASELDGHEILDNLSPSEPLATPTPVQRDELSGETWAEVEVLGKADASVQTEVVYEAEDLPNDMVPRHRVDRLLEQVVEKTTERVMARMTDSFGRRMEKVFAEIEILRAENHALSNQVEALHDELAVARDELEMLEGHTEMDEDGVFALNESGPIGDGLGGSAPHACCSYQLDDAGLAQNDLCLPVDCAGRVDWEKSIPDSGLCQHLRLEAEQGRWQCCECHRCLVHLPGNYGTLYLEDNFEDEWEEKNVLCSWVNRRRPSSAACAAILGPRRAGIPHAVVAAEETDARAATLMKWLRTLVTVDVCLQHLPLPRNCKRPQS